MTKVLSGRLQEGQRTLRKRLTEFGLGVGGNVENTVASPRRKGKKKVKNDSVRAAEVATGSGTPAKTEQSEAVPVVPTQSQESSVPSGTLAASQQEEPKPSEDAQEPKLSLSGPELLRELQLLRSDAEALEARMAARFQGCSGDVDSTTAKPARRKKRYD